MELPGGLLADGRRRDFAFRPLSGKVELALAEAAAEPCLPAAVTAVLAAALAQVGGRPASEGVVRELAVGDRQFLARRLAVELGQESLWLTAACGACDGSFDLLIEPPALPVKEAGPGFPFATVETERGCLRLRVPTGADQEAIAAIPDPDEARLALFERCLVEGPAGPWREEEVAAAEEALEATAPEVALGVLATCPECGREAEVAVDPYLALGPGEGSIFDDVHTLASAYHWSERQILALPQARRRTYLRRVDRARGLAQ